MHCSEDKCLVLFDVRGFFFFKGSLMIFWFARILC